jgi:hypothetical protein
MALKLQGGPPLRTNATSVSWPDRRLVADLDRAALDKDAKDCESRSVAGAHLTVAAVDKMFDVGAPGLDFAVEGVEHTPGALA